MVLSHIKVRLVLQTQDCPTYYANRIDIKLCKHVHEWFRIIPNVTQVWWHLVLLHFPETHGKCQFFPVALLPISTKVKIGCYSENKLISSRKMHLLITKTLCWKFPYLLSHTVLKIGGLDIWTVKYFKSITYQAVPVLWPMKTDLTFSKYRLSVVLFDLLQKKWKQRQIRRPALQILLLCPLCDTSFWTWRKV